MTHEKAIDIFERMLSHYQGELYTDSEKEIKEAFELGKQALETGEIYMRAVDYNLFLEGYKQGKKDFGRPQGEWITRHKQNSFGHDVVCFECNKCGKYTLPIIYTMITEPLEVCPNCGADMKGKENDA